MRITIEASKTDPFRKGIHIFFGVTGNTLCPVTALLSYMASRGDSPSPLFHFEDGRHLTRKQLSLALRRALTYSGVDASCFSGHSFRIGAATTAAQKGVEDSVIRMVGRWESSAYLRYIRTPREHLAAISKTICNP